MVDADPDQQPLVGERIVVIGNTSSGKTTMAAQLAELITGKHVELDALYWLPNWVEPHRSDFLTNVRVAVEDEPRWAASGNYLGRGVQQVLWPQADTLIWLDLPLHTILRRVVTRSWRRSRSGELLWGTNSETFWKHLKLWDQQQSLISFAIQNHRPKQRDYAAELADPTWANLKKYRLRSPKAVANFLERAEREAAAAPGSEVTDG